MAGYYPLVLVAVKAVFISSYLLAGAVNFVLFVVE